MFSKPKRPKIGIVIGSNRPTRVCREVAEWSRRQLAHEALDYELIDLAEVNLPFLDEPEMPARHRYRHEHTKAWSRTVASCQGFVFVFPQYNWGYPAVLKNALDFLYDEWACKPVSLVCYGNHGGFQATMALKMVTQGLHMDNLATHPPLDIDEGMFSQGQFKDIEKALSPSRHAMKAVAAEFADRLC